MIRYFILLIFPVFVLNSCDSSTKTPEISKKTKGWELVWSDEFDYEGLPDEKKWSYSVGDGCPAICGWGNNELEYYTHADTSNVRVKNGFLTIESKKEEIHGKFYSSAKLVTKGTQEWLYGKFEIRAKLPSGKGTWPAIWMMPSKNKYGGWPKSGEIDIMEHVGYSPDTIVGTVHTEAYNHILGTQVGKYVYEEHSESAFHTYSIIWTKNKIGWFIDGKQYHSFINEGMSYKEWPFDHPFYLILNLAIGGNWGGKYGVDDSIFPQQMIVDFVRVYQMK